MGCSQEDDEEDKEAWIAGEEVKAKAIFESHKERFVSETAKFLCEKLREEDGDGKRGPWVCGEHRGENGGQVLKRRPEDRAAF